MNDRYLFRAKHSLESKKWHIGNLVEEPDGLYLRDNKNNIMVYIQDPSTICQCTGLKDKNGKLIWENDITLRTSVTGTNKGKIIYSSDGSFCQKDFETTFENLLIHSDSYFEVIGNIFDNTELMHE